MGSNTLERDLYMDFLKGLTMLLVVVGHSISNDLDMSELFDFIYSFHMPLLIFIQDTLKRKILKNTRKLDII